MGWSGCQALRWRHLVAAQGQRPCGVVFGIACDTLKHARSATPVGWRWVYEGQACTYVGAGSALKIPAAIRMAEELGGLLAQDGHQTIGHLLADLDQRLSSDPHLAPARRAFQQFRLIGHPLQRLCRASRPEAEL